MPGLRHGPHLHGAHHDQATHAHGRPHPRADDLRPLRGRRPRHRRHGHRGARRPGPHGRAADVRHHLLRHHDRRRPLRPAGAPHPPRRGRRPGEDRARHGDPRGRGLARRRRIHDLHRHDGGHAAHLPQARHEPGRAHLHRRPRERHAQHRPVGRPDRPRGGGPQGLADRHLRADDPVAPRGHRPRDDLRLDHGPPRAQPPGRARRGAGRGRARRGRRHGRHRWIHRRLRLVARRSRRPATPRGGLITMAPALVRAETAAVSTLGTTMLDPDRDTLRPRMIWFNLGLTLVVLALLIMDQLPLAYVFMVGAAIALIFNFRVLKDQGERIAAHAPSVVGVVSMVLAAGVLIGVLNGTGMVSAMSAWLVTIIPDALGPGLAVITGVLSIPMTFFMSNDAFYYGMLPVLAESAANYGIDPVEMARASITGQPVHLQSPLVPAILLLVSLADVNLGDHHRKVLWRAVLVSLVMLAVGVLTAAIPI
ncbi:SLC13 family permease [Clavibacter zhangzhiyongii]|uniref:SLC13 family permease n=1 Tax=Clavibacter zhangzhiyongii TaxID=2768071 RepID=UPI0039DF90DD